MTPLKGGTYRGPRSRWPAHISTPLSELLWPWLKILHTNEQDLKFTSALAAWSSSSTYVWCTYKNSACLCLSYSHSPPSQSERMISEKQNFLQLAPKLSPVVLLRHKEDTLVQVCVFLLLQGTSKSNLTPK